MKKSFWIRKAFEPKKFYDYDDIKYKGIRNVRNLFDLSIDEDCYKPIKTNDAFNGYHIECKRSKGDRGKTLSMKEYLDMIKPYLSNIINNHKTQGKWKVHSDSTIINYKTQGEWKIQLTMTINFMASKDFVKTRTMHAKSNNIEIMIGNETDELIRELFDSLLQRYQEGLEESMRGSEFLFDSIDLLCYKIHKISLNRNGSYIDFHEWLKNKKTTINPKNNDDNYFQYAFIDQYNWKGADFPSSLKTRMNHTIWLIYI